MSRLIDADALNRIIFEIGCHKTKMHPMEVMDIIKEQPTAYDVEKVVAELKDNCDIYSVKYYQENVDVKAVQIDEAIDIVKRGGIE